jgi:cellulose synthase/poly-beta-1,6-N-acetylglucosamine synthase-like glycosyltransferase
MTVVAFLFWLAAGVVVYAYVGYPALIHLAARLWPAPPVREDESTPTVTVVIAAHNEEACLGEKLRSVLALDYPRDRLEILVGSDGSTDRTEAIAAGFAESGVRLLAFPGPRGKAAVLNDVTAHARGDILVMTDARQTLAPDAVRRLVSCFADPMVGAVSGELHLLPSPDSPARGVGLYWRYEKAVRQAESRFDSTVGVTGALYALRRALFKPLDPRTILDDVAVPMEIVLAGYRVLFAPKASAFDHIESDSRREYRRKVRTLAGNYQLLALRPALLDPLRNRLLWQLISHKVSRLAVPWCLLLLLLASALLARAHWFYAMALVAQLAFYGLALAGWRSARRQRPLRLTSLPYTFALLNLAAASGLLGFLRGTTRATWKAAP